MFKDIADSILSCEKAIILPHTSADGDCLGSAFALKLIMEFLGKKADVILEEENPKTCGILYVVEGEGITDANLAVAVDCGDYERLGSRKNLFDRCAVTVNIDHHPTNSRFAMHNYVDINSAATGQIIFELAEYMNIPVTKEIANNLYTAISSDTGRFAFNNTTPKTLHIAAELVEKGIDFVGINEFLFEKNPMSKIFLMRDALNSFETYADGKIAVVSVTKQQVIASGATEEDAGGLISLPRSLDTALISLCFRESVLSEEIKVSLRSNIYDVSAIAQKFGGGGHVRASGCTVKSDMQSAKNIVLQEIYRVME